MVGSIVIKDKHGWRVGTLGGGLWLGKGWIYARNLGS